MRLIMEDRLLEISASVFYTVLNEYLSETDPIKKANYYWKLEHPKGKFNPNFMKVYAKQFPIIDIKDDILTFVVNFANELRKIPDISTVLSYKSPDFGFSTYMHIYFTKPTDERLSEYVKNNLKKYDNVKFRFSEHDEYSNKSNNDEPNDDSKKSSGNVDYFNKNFIQAAEEMRSEVLAYIDSLRDGEKEYIKQLGAEQDKDKKESLRLNISRGVLLNERLEEISTATYATDSVGDIVNWLLNKPKPYRILYDKKYDVWVIADAMSNTHKDMSIDLFDSDYLYGISSKVDDYINFARHDGNFNSGYTNAEVYSDYGFDNFQLKGLFFIPKNMQYRDYEESGFYSHEVPITTGSLFVQRPSELSEHGIFKDLYNKLDRLNALKSSLKSIYLDCRRNYGSDWLQYFYDEAEEWEYDEDEVQEFLNRYGIVGILKEV